MSVTITGKKAPTGFLMLPEGEQVLHVTNVKGLPRTNASLITMDMKNADGIGFGGQYPQKYDLNSDGGWFAFYNLLLHGYEVNLEEGDSFDINELEDTYVTVEIVHKRGTRPRATAVPDDEGNYKDSDYPVFANIAKTLGPGEPFGDEAPAAASKGEDEESWD